ncbi:MAG: tetratricopeptide repeat protein [Promethearchaeota archaeon]
MKKLQKGVNFLPNLNDYKLALAQKLKDQCKDKEALEILNNIENVDDFTIDEQNSFYLLQSSLFYHLSPYTKALDTADWVLQKNIKTGNILVMLDAFLARGKALFRLGKTEECYNSILKCEAFISRIKDQPEKIIGKRKMDLGYIKGLYYWQIGKFDKALAQGKIFLALSKKYGTKRDLSVAFDNLGTYSFNTGDYIKALENLENSLSLHKELNNKIGMASVYNNIGEIYRLQGDLERGLEHYKYGLSLNEERGHKDSIAVNLNNIGMTYYQKGELDKGLNYLKRSLQLRKEIGNHFEISRTLFHIIKIYLDQNNLESVRTYFEDIKNLSEKNDNKRIYRRYHIAKALILKKTGKTPNIIKAEEMLKEILEEDSIENELLIIVLLNLSELLYKELLEKQGINLFTDSDEKELIQNSKEIKLLSILKDV